MTSSWWNHGTTRWRILWIQGKVADSNGQVPVDGSDIFLSIHNSRIDDNRMVIIITAWIRYPISKSRFGSDPVKQGLNSLWLRDAIWWHISRCLTAPSHYLNQCWLFIRGVMWHSSKTCFLELFSVPTLSKRLKDVLVKLLLHHPESMSQWLINHEADV